MPSESNSTYAELCGLVREGVTLASVSSLLNWDQETYMPPAGAEARAEQQSLLAGIAHERKTHPRIGELLSACERDRDLTGDPDSETARNIREMRRDYDREAKLPKSFVEEWAKVTSQATEVWKEARQKSDFKMFAPWLDRVFGLARQRAACLGTPAGGEPYDALLDEYEPGATAKELDATFAGLRPRLADLIARVAASKKKIDLKPLQVKVEAARQHQFGLMVLEAIGFDLRAGRLDTTTHPFCSGIAPGDTRLTTRYRDERFTDALYGTLHEAGHGMYEQGLPKLVKNGGGVALYGTPLSQDISLGIHESQSRMWENFVGRSKSFWKWALPRAKKAFGRGLAVYTVNDLFRAVNTCVPSLIRVEADEGTYNMHIMIRFELERAVLSGSLNAADVPAEWNRRYKSLLGIDVPDDRRGCLQDVHWSFGLVGYFPTYTLGNLYAAQLWEKINADLPDLDGQIAKGKFVGLKEWLNQHIHKHGRRWRAGELCQRVTGKPLSAEPLLRHLEGKLGQVYGL